MDTAAIECQVCLRSGNSQLHLYCPTCARNALYEPRVQHAQVLLTREALGKEVELVLNGGKRVAGTRSLQTSETMNGHISSRITYERAEAECAHSTERTRTVLSHVEALRTQTKLIKDDIAKRKASLSQRQKVLTSIKQELVQQKVKVVEPLQKGYGNTENRWNALHNKSAESRIFLCREAARLYGLQQRKRKKGVPGRDSYLIGGVPIVDLRDINTATPVQITVSITYLAHLLHLTSHYLSLRMPAEIILPSTNNPHAQIFSPLSSYNFSTLPSPSSKSFLSTRFPTSSTPPTTKTPPRPRPLHLDKPLQALATEDAIAYSLFVDGITLLAWDVAWVCKTQGLDIGGKSWEDVCAMGRNIWLLLVAPPQAAISRGLIPDKSAPDSRNGTPTKPDTTTVKALDPYPTKKVVEGADAKEHVRPSHFSHGTNHSFLAAAEGEAFMRSWKLASPVRVIEKVKAALASERMGAEWEMLEDREWADEGKEDDGARTVEGDEKVNQGEANTVGEKGRSGWMKVKNRGGES